VRLTPLKLCHRLFSLKALYEYDDSHFDNDNTYIIIMIMRVAYRLVHGWVAQCMVNVRWTGCPSDMGSIRTPPPPRWKMLPAGGDIGDECNVCIAKM